MASFNRSARASWPILAVVIVVAAGVWGLYAWKYAAPAGLTRTATSDSPTPDSDSAGEHLTTLRATRPTAAPALPGGGETSEPDHTAGGLSSSVSVNAPSTLQGEEIEITLAKNASRATPVQPLTPAPAGTSAPQSEIAERVQSGKSLQARGDLIAARSAFSSALDRGLPETQENGLRGELSRISNALLFSRATNTADPLTAIQTIAAGDTIHVIAKQNHITEELMATINGVTEPNRLAVGQRLKVIRGPFRAVIYKSRHRMDIYLGEIFVRSFRVGLGTNGGTPTGSWVVLNKLSNPDWTDPRNGRHYLADDPDNPIGERWIGLTGIAGKAVGKQGFGIHGTIDPKSIGDNLSMGCVRLTADDVKFVYDLLVERDSQVEIRP